METVWAKTLNQSRRVGAKMTRRVRRLWHRLSPLRRRLSKRTRCTDIEVTAHSKQMILRESDSIEVASRIVRDG